VLDISIFRKPICLAECGHPLCNILGKEIHYVTLFILHGHPAAVPIRPTAGWLCATDILAVVKVKQSPLARPRWCGPHRTLSDSFDPRCRTTLHPCCTLVENCRDSLVTRPDRVLYKKAVFQTLDFLLYSLKMSLKSKKRVKRSSLEMCAVKAAEAPAFPNIDKGSKLLELPLELIMEILSHFDHLPIITGKLDCSPFGVDPTISRRYLGRTDVLRALSQTCKLWRNLFFPLLWERLEPCLTHSKAAAWYKVYGESLIRKSSLVCENQEIALHVRYVQIRSL